MSNDEGSGSDDEDVDGMPLDGAALLKGGIARGRAKLAMTRYNVAFIKTKLV